MKILARCGLTKDGVVPAKKESSHGRWMFLWKLTDAQKAQDVLQRLRKVLPMPEPRSETQTTFNL